MLPNLNKTTISPFPNQIFTRLLTLFELLTTKLSMQLNTTAFGSRYYPAHFQAGTQSFGMESTYVCIHVSKFCLNYPDEESSKPSAIDFHILPYSF